MTKHVVALLDRSAVVQERRGQRIVSSIFASGGYCGEHVAGTECVVSLIVLESQTPRFGIIVNQASDAGDVCLRRIEERRRRRTGGVSVRCDIAVAIVVEPRKAKTVVFPFCAERIKGNAHHSL